MREDKEKIEKEGGEEFLLQTEKNRQRKEVDFDGDFQTSLEEAGCGPYL